MSERVREWCPEILARPAPYLRHWRGGGGKYHQITALFDATTYVLEVHNHSGGWGNGSVHLRGVKSVEVTVVRQGHYATAYENEELPSH